MRVPHFRRSLASCLVLTAACNAGPTTPSETSPRTTPAAPAAPELRVEGLSPSPMTFTVADLEALGAEDLAWAHHADSDTYRGVAIDKVLARAGLDAGQGGPGVAADAKHLGWRRVVVAEALDGFTAVFSSAELLPDIGPTRALVAWAKNGAPLPADEAPLRLLVLTDKKGSRSVRQLVGLHVKPATIRM